MFCREKIREDFFFPHTVSLRPLEAAGTTDLRRESARRATQSLYTGEGIIPFIASFQLESVRSVW